MVNGVPRKVFTSNNTNAPNLTDYEIQGAELLSQEQSIYIDYQRDVDEPAMPAYFVQLLIYQMAWHLAEPVTDQTTKSDYWKVWLLELLLKAYEADTFDKQRLLMALVNPRKFLLIMCW